VKSLQYLIYVCFVLIAVGGGGTIVGLLAHAEAARLPFMYVLLGGLSLFGLTLVGALAAGVYLYLFQGRRSIGYFRRR